MLFQQLIEICKSTVKVLVFNIIKISSQDKKFSKNYRQNYPVFMAFRHAFAASQSP